MSYLISEGAAPSTPASGKVAIYAKTDGGVYSKDDTGTETNVTGLRLGTSASASGTTIDFTSIPEGMKKITISFSLVSTNGTSIPLIQIGDSGGIENTGYTGSASVLTAAVTSSLQTTGFGLTNAMAAASVFNGNWTLSLLDASTNTWTASGSVGFSNSAAVGLGAGAKSLTGTLDRVRITTVNGTDSYDAGTINIMYE
jgi:hypothetical protein